MPFIVNTTATFQFMYQPIPDQMTPPPVTPATLVPGPDPKVMAGAPVLAGPQTLTIPPGWATAGPPVVSAIPPAIMPGVTVAPAVVNLTPTATKVMTSRGPVITDTVMGVGVASGTAPATPPPAGPGTTAFNITFTVKFANAGQTKVQAM